MFANVSFVLFLKLQVAENEKNAAGGISDSTFPGSPGVVVNAINNNVATPKGSTLIHGQPSNVGVGGDGITTVSINPTLNSSSPEHLTEEGAANASKPKGK